METVRSFGAIGDGVTDDTQAVQDWLDAGGYFLEDGAFRTGPLILNGDGRTLRTEGARLIASAADMAMLTVSGADCTISAHLDGNSLAAIGLRIIGPRATVEGGYIHDVQAKSVTDARAIDATTDGGITIRNNTLARIHNGKTGGFSRAIAVNSVTVAKGDTDISDNRINGVTGPEGDAIQILFNDGGEVFLDSKASVSRNQIRNASRRFIKVQGSNTVVRDNTLRYDMGTPEMPSNFIDAFKSDDVSIVGNDIGAGLLASPISVTGTSRRRNTGIVVARNITRQLDTRDIASIYLEWLTDSAAVGNIGFGGGDFTSIGNCTNVLVDGPVHFRGLASRRTVRGTNTNTSTTVRMAANMNPSRTAYVVLDGSGHREELNFSSR